MSLFRSGLNSCVAPSSHSCTSPLLRALAFNGSLSTARRNISGAKFGMPERELLALGERVADVDRTVIVQADDVTGERLVGRAAVGSHERQRIGDAHLFVEA